MKYRSANLPRVANLLLRNTKHHFGPMKLGRYTLVITQNVDVAEQLIPLLVSTREETWIQVRKAGGKLIIVDADVMLNVRFAQAMGMWRSKSEYTILS